jgi:hypothetical protein
VRREAARGIVADNLLTAGTNSRSISRTPVQAWRGWLLAVASADPPPGPFNKVDGLFTVLMCADCQAPTATTAAPIER